MGSYAMRLLVSVLLLVGFAPGKILTKEEFLLPSDLHNNLLGGEACKGIGFNTENLPCSYCEILQEFQLSELHQDCSGCCNPTLNPPEPEKTIGSETVSLKFAKAKLEVCWCKFPSMPQIEAFVKSDLPKKFKNLEVKHINYQNPIIKLMNKDGEIERTMSITKWTTETVVEFLSTHLEE